jgi:UDP-N-acetylmuramoyl-tripeptide--D-alanyl-D-alanine ligase
MLDGLKIMVTPGMVELGEAQDELNRQFGVKAAKVCDYVVLVGENRTKSISEGLIIASFPKERAKAVETLEQAFEEIGKIDAGGRQKVVLLENDLPDNY